MRAHSWINGAVMSGNAHIDTNAAIRRIRRSRRRVAQRRRGGKLLAGGAALGLAIATAAGIASFTGTDLAGAAVTRAQDVLDLIDKRSPGARTEARLTKTRALSEAISAPEALSPMVHAPINIAALLAPPKEEWVPVAAAPAPALFMTPPAPGVFFTPSPGSGGGAPGGGGGGPGGGGGSPPGSPPQTIVPIPPVPEPGTWMTMLLGFAAIGWILRRQKGAFATERGA